MPGIGLGWKRGTANVLSKLQPFITINTQGALLWEVVSLLKFDVMIPAAPCTLCLTDHFI